jgi:hypothetical protein
VTHALAAVFFLGFALLTGLMALRLRRSGEGEARRLRSVLILYVVAVTGLAAVSQRELWPFSSWRLMAVEAPNVIGEDTERVRLALRTAAGREYAVDHRAVEPLDFGELRGWFRQLAGVASPAELEPLGRFLLARANASRLQVLEGGTPGTFDRVLGPLTAPKHTVYPSVWRSAAAVPTEPFVELLVYREAWSVEGRGGGGAAVTLEPLYRYRTPR